MPPVYGGGGEKCRICCKTVYAAEMVTANDWTFHKLCFRCTACNQKLGTDWCVDSSTNNMYCKPHFLQLVKTTGVVAEKDDARSRRSSSSTQQPNEEPPSSLPPADKAAAPESAAAVQTPSVPTVAASGHKLKSRTLSFGGGGGEKCHRCRKTVYVAERAQAQGNVFHKLCFTCTECNSKLSANNWCVDTGGNLYCKPHFTQLLQASGGKYNLGNAAAEPPSAAPKPSPAPVPAPAPAATPAASDSVMATTPAQAPAAALTPAGDAPAKSAAPKVKRTFSFGGGGGEKCHRCRKTVYLAERAQAQGNVFHKLCFTCTECNSKLSANNWCVDTGGNLYCKPHFTQLLRSSGGKYNLGNAAAEPPSASPPPTKTAWEAAPAQPPVAAPAPASAATPAPAPAPKPAPAAAPTLKDDSAGESGTKVSKVKRTFSFGGGGGEKCHRCRKTVYLAERAQAQGNVFHKLCFTCTECNSKLGPNNWCVDTGGNLYCKPHFTQLLKSGGGNYNISGGSRPSDSKYAAVDSAGQSGASTLPSATRTRSTSGGGMVSRLVNSAHEKLSAVTSGVVSQQMQVAVEKPASRKELTPATPSAVVLGSSQDEQGEGSSPSSGSNPSPPPAALDAAQPAATGEQRVKKRVVEMSGRRRKPKQHAKPGEPTSATEQVEQAS